MSTFERKLRVKCPTCSNEELPVVPNADLDTEVTCRCGRTFRLVEGIEGEAQQIAMQQAEKEAEKMLRDIARKTGMKFTKGR